MSRKTKHEIFIPSAYIYHVLVKKIIQGIDMRNLERNNRIIIKEVIVDYETTNTISNNDEPTNWNQLCQWLHNGMIQQFEDTLSVNNDDFTFMIDDMEAMEITSLDSTTNSVQFMSRCLNQMYKQCGHCQGIICFGRKSSHSNTSSFSLSDYCRQRADIIVDVNPLSTGYSTDIHGIIRVYSRNLSPSTVNVSENNFAKADTTRIWQQSLIFKALDSGVKCSVIKKKIAVLKTI